MRLTAAVCAALLASSGCALAHERSSFVPAIDAGPIAVVDAAPDPDTGTPTSCTERWASLPWCPADPASALGRPCTTEGQLCGVNCCEPAPALACTGGVWVPATPPECRGVDCIGPSPCGDGACGFGRICLSTSSEVPQPLRCVVPPFPVNSCGAVPSEWLTTDPRTCNTCLCGGPPEALRISLECACCDR